MPQLDKHEQNSCHKLTSILKGHLAQWLLLTAVVVCLVTTGLALEQVRC